MLGLDGVGLKWVSLAVSYLDKLRWSALTTKSKQTFMAGRSRRVDSPMFLNNSLTQFMLLFIVINCNLNL